MNPNRVILSSCGKPSCLDCFSLAFCTSPRVTCWATTVPFARSIPTAGFEADADAVPATTDENEPLSKGARMNRWAWRLVLASACTPPLAAAPPTPPISDWSKIETVVVTAQLPGPVLWHVQQGSSDVWILATVAPVHANLSWDNRTVAKLLIGAHLLLVPPRGEVGVFEGAWFALTSLDTLQQPDGV